MELRSGPWSVSVEQDVGRAREHQEDFAECAEDGEQLLLVVCDGMGGHAAGREAAVLAGSILKQHFFAAVRERDPDVRWSLWSALVEANDTIKREATGADKHGMGSTAVIGWLRGAEVWVAHVGDSRLLQLRDGALVFRTKDHTRVQKMVDAGILTVEEAQHHQDANVVLRALGHMPDEGSDPEKRPEVRNEPLRVNEGDTILLCSDGLYDLVSESEIGSLLVEKPPAAAARALVELANERGGTDNISVAIAAYGGRSDTSERAVPGEARRTAATTPDEAETSAVRPAAPKPTAKQRPLPWKAIAIGASTAALAAVLALLAVVWKTRTPEAGQPKPAPSASRSTLPEAGAP
jgi:protein phosphatase